MNSSLSALRAQVNERHQELISAAERVRSAKRLATRVGDSPARRPNRTVALRAVR